MARTASRLDARTPSIEAGDWVLVEGPRLGRFSEKVGGELKTKLHPMFLGPHKVLEKLGDVMFK
eukprot:15482759-Alexandrium_andersonii.AAC.1